MSEPIKRVYIDPSRLSKSVPLHTQMYSAMAAMNTTNINQSKRYLPIGPSWSKPDECIHYILMNKTKQKQPTRTNKPSQDSIYKTGKKMSKF
jgi:hypothetical protein